MDKFKGKTAFITGGASGIGLALGKTAAAAGMNVVLADLRRPVLDEALQWFRDNGKEAYGIELNVTNREAYEKAAEDAVSKFGNIHILFNNAGIGCTRGRLWEVTYDDTDIALDINLRGVLNGIQVIVPGMLAHGEGGHIVNTSSKNGLLPPASLGLYNLTKGAVVCLTETLAAELPEGYGTSVFCPGPFSTNLGVTSQEVPAIIQGKTFEPPPPRQFTDDGEEKFFIDDAPAGQRPAEEAARLVFRGIRRGDLYIITHSEFYEGVKARYDAVLRAFPKYEPNEVFKSGMLSFLTYNPEFAKQREYR
jgi:NAD(P)-dependent dehydrogenase (short-subunit alcohol dehydrogenase family)